MSADPRAVLRRRQVVSMLLLAVRDNPGASWEQAARLAGQFGGRLDPPVTAAEARALAGVTIGQVFGNAGLDAGLLAREAARVRHRL